MARIKIMKALSFLMMASFIPNFSTRENSVNAFKSYTIEEPDAKHSRKSRLVFHGVENSLDVPPSPIYEPTNESPPAPAGPGWLYQ
jgi:hypothetical protein